MYSLVKKFLFSLDPEIAHEISLDALGAAERLRLLKPFCPEIASDPVEVMGLHFPNRVGLAAGLDKNGDYFNALGQLGFGFVEIGTITPLPQPGNPEPRLFRLEKHNAIINRMGFNNKGLAHLCARARQRRFKGILGINIGKNKITPDEQALNDYLLCMEQVYPLADYITVNISSPNTPGLRNLQFGQALDDLLAGIKQKQNDLRSHYGKYVPIAVKIAPDMSEVEVQQVAQSLLQHQIDGVIATNTTISREGVEDAWHCNEAGGLSGVPVREKSTRTIKLLAKYLQQEIPIIGVGGIFSAADAKEKIEAGASLVQIYTGFIYRGPKLIEEIAEALAKR